MSSFGIGMSPPAGNQKTHMRFIPKDATSPSASTSDDNLSTLKDMLSRGKKITIPVSETAGLTQITIDEKNLSEGAYLDTLNRVIDVINEKINARDTTADISEKLKALFDKTQEVSFDAAAVQENAFELTLLHQLLSYGRKGGFEKIQSNTNKITQDFNGNVGKKWQRTERFGKHDDATGQFSKRHTGKNETAVTSYIKDLLIWADTPGKKITNKTFNINAEGKVTSSGGATTTTTAVRPEPPVAVNTNPSLPHAPALVTKNPAVVGTPPAITALEEALEDISFEGFDREEDAKLQAYIDGLGEVIDAFESAIGELDDGEDDANTQLKAAKATLVAAQATLEADGLVELESTVKDALNDAAEKLEDPSLGDIQSQLKSMAGQIPDADAGSMGGIDTHDSMLTTGTMNRLAAKTEFGPLKRIKSDIDDLLKTGTPITLEAINIKVSNKSLQPLAHLFAMTQLMENGQDADAFETFTSLLTDVRESYGDDDTSTEKKFKAMYIAFSMAIDSTKTNGMTEEDILGVGEDSQGIQDENLKTLMLGLKDLLDTTTYRTASVAETREKLRRKSMRTLPRTTKPTLGADIEGITKLAGVFKVDGDVDGGDAVVVAMGQVLDNADKLIKLSGTDIQAESLQLVINCIKTERFSIHNPDEVSAFEQVFSKDKANEYPVYNMMKLAQEIKDEYDIVTLSKHIKTAAANPYMTAEDIGQVLADANLDINSIKQIIDKADLGDGDGVEAKKADILQSALTTRFNAITHNAEISDLIKEASEAGIKPEDIGRALGMSNIEFTDIKAAMEIAPSEDGAPQLDKATKAEIMQSALVEQFKISGDAAGISVLINEAIGAEITLEDIGRALGHSTLNLENIKDAMEIASDEDGSPQLDKATKAEIMQSALVTRFNAIPDGDEAQNQISALINEAKDAGMAAGHIGRALGRSDLTVKQITNVVDSSSIIKKDTAKGLALVEKLKSTDDKKATFDAIKGFELSDKDKKIAIKLAVQEEILGLGAKATTKSINEIITKYQGVAIDDINATIKAGISMAIRDEVSKAKDTAAIKAIIMKYQGIQVGGTSIESDVIKEGISMAIRAAVNGADSKETVERIIAKYNGVQVGGEQIDQAVIKEGISMAIRSAVNGADSKETVERIIAKYNGVQVGGTTFDKKQIIVAYLQKKGRVDLDKITYFQTADVTHKELIAADKLAHDKIAELVAKQLGDLSPTGALSKTYGKNYNQYLTGSKLPEDIKKRAVALTIKEKLKAAEDLTKELKKFKDVKIGGTKIDQAVIKEGIAMAFSSELEGARNAAAKQAVIKKYEGIEFEGKEEVIILDDVQSIPGLQGSVDKTIELLVSNPDTMLSLDLDGTVFDMHSISLNVPGVQTAYDNEGKNTTLRKTAVANVREAYDKTNKSALTKGARYFFYAIMNHPNKDALVKRIVFNTKNYKGIVHQIFDTEPKGELRDFLKKIKVVRDKHCTEESTFPTGKTVIHVDDTKTHGEQNTEKVKGVWTGNYLEPEKSSAKQCNKDEVGLTKDVFDRINAAFQ